MLGFSLRSTNYSTSAQPFRRQSLTNLHLCFYLYLQIYSISAHFTMSLSKVVKMTSWTLTKLGGSVLPKLVESVWSKCVKLTTDNACNSAISIKDFEFNLKDLQKNTKILVAKAYDVEEEIQYLERSGRKKRKREVRQWLEDVTSIKKQVVELETEVKSQGFIMRLTDGGLPAKLNDDVDKLVVQSRYFGDLVLNVCGSRPRDRLPRRNSF